MVNFFCCIAFAQQINIVSTQEDFSTFWSKAKDLPFLEQEKLWTSFEHQYEGIYVHLLPNGSTLENKKNRENILRQFFLKVPALESGMQQLYAHAQQIGKQQAAKFRREFPNMPDGMTVIFAPTFGINGAVRNVKSLDKNALIIGVDKLAESHESLDILFSHEFFHLYQIDVLRDADYGITMATPLWIEGFATQVSQRLNPEASDAAQLMSKELAVFCTPANIKLWAAQYLEVIDLPANGKPYADWFRTVAESRPVRRGYCLGRSALGVLSKDNPLPTMVAWDEAAFSTKLKTALFYLSKNSP